MKQNVIRSLSAIVFGLGVQYSLAQEAIYENTQKFPVRKSSIYRAAKPAWKRTGDRKSGIENLEHETTFDFYRNSLEHHFGLEFEFHIEYPLSHNHSLSDLFPRVHREHLEENNLKIIYRKEF